MRASPLILVSIPLPYGDSADEPRREQFKEPVMNNPNIPMRDRAEVQTHLDAINSALPPPALTLANVATGQEGTTTIYRLADGAEERVRDAYPDPATVPIDAFAFFAIPIPEPANYAFVGLEYRINDGFSSKPVDIVEPVVEEPKSKPAAKAAPKPKTSKKSK
jgi:hypothetical protein